VWAFFAIFLIINNYRNPFIINVLEITPIGGRYQTRAISHENLQSSKKNAFFALPKLPEHPYDI
jgi:hypothetical protein